MHIAELGSFDLTSLVYNLDSEVNALGGSFNSVDRYDFMRPSTLHFQSPEVCFQRQRDCKMSIVTS